MEKSSLDPSQQPPGDSNTSLPGEGAENDVELDGEPLTSSDSLDSLAMSDPYDREEIDIMLASQAAPKAPTRLQEWDAISISDSPLKRDIKAKVYSPSQMSPQERFEHYKSLLEHAQSALAKSEHPVLFHLSNIFPVFPQGFTFKLSFPIPKGFRSLLFLLVSIS